MGSTGHHDHIRRFGVFEVDLEAGQLRKNGRRVRLQEQPFRVLALLLEKPGRVVTREELQEKVWPDTHVDFDHSLNTAINKIREALGDSAPSPRFVETLPGRGYKFLAPVEGDGVQPEAEPGEGPPPEADPQETIRKQRMALTNRAWAVAAVAIVAALAAWFLPSRESASREPAAPVRRFAFTPPAALVTVSGTTSVAISPNGGHIAFTTAGEEGKLWVFDFVTGNSRALDGTEGAHAPFWSPGSDFIAFGVSGELWKIPTRGGPAIRLCETFGASGLAGGTWSPDGDSIVFGSYSGPTVFREVPARGGTPKVVIPATESAGSLGRPRRPHFLPGASRRVLVFTSSESTLTLLDLETGFHEDLGPGDGAFYSPSGHLIYQGSGGVWAMPFSLDSLKATGEAFLIAQNGINATVAADHTLAYYGGSGVQQNELIWLNRRGEKVAGTGVRQGTIHDPSLSPDGRLSALSAIEGSNRDIWVWEIARGVKTRLSFDPSVEWRTVWSPDGEKVAFSSRRSGSWQIFLQQVQGGRNEEAILTPPQTDWVSDWSRDGRYILFGRASSDTSLDVWYLTRKENGGWEPRPFLQTPAVERVPRISPDGRYVAYMSDESGRDEIYVQPFPEGGRRVTVSNNGGTAPRWSRDGQELFYVEGSTLVAVSVSAGETFSVEASQRLFEHPNLAISFYSHYDVSEDGERFLIAEPVGEPEEPQIRVVQNWYEEFRDGNVQ